jgi:hypothetical protein
MSDRENIIVIIDPNTGKIETWGSLTEICKPINHPELKYNYLKRLKFPFTYKGLKFTKSPFKTVLIKHL